MKWNKSN